ncbi:ADP-ribosylglycohydrolase [Microbacterium sp. cf046]|uniref:ADP-ribosylglycohydrolase family protein n=1 Tax=Microbacterium sp. cf046 TaxID=1761803 RepID=UPI0008E6BD2E|nr:ADP-ribosylglycohydrolase family protein [Microbacterium sp. cf046]SFR93104.1 ADP-ribosylglycohydrolase [Microbacterium sp. cf046]
MLHDPLLPSQLAAYELLQRDESGFDVARFVDGAIRPDEYDPPEPELLLAQLESTARRPGWPYIEPESLDDILPASPSEPIPPLPAYDRYLGAWLGRIAGCNLGKPIEEGRIWTSARIREYLERAASYPLRDYIPVLDPMPEGFELRDNWPETTRGNVDGSARDDDIDYPILGLLLLEQRGAELTTADVAEGWLAYLPYARVYTAERATYVNLLHGIPADAAGEHRNPWREWVGALIRGDVFGWTHPGRPIAAARLAYRDARLSHRANGVYGEMWSAALTASALVERNVEPVLERSMAVVPAGSRLAEAIDLVRGLHRSGATWDDALDEIKTQYGHYEWVHTIGNAALITAGLLWSEGDFATGVGNTVQGGWDTDSNGATVGSVLGALLGADALPAQFVQPLDDRTRSAVFGFDHSRISALAERTRSLAARFAGDAGDDDAHARAPLASRHEPSWPGERVGS